MERIMAGEDAVEISIVVTNWNGEEFLDDCLSTLWRSGEASGHAFELIVVDDVSTDGSVRLIEERFPQVRLARNPENVGFARTSNRGAREARGRILVMMNNDMRVPEDFLRHLVAPFHEPAEPDAPPVFAVGAKTVDWHTGETNHLCMDAAWRRGGLGQDWSDPPERCETTFPQGGSAAFDRELFLRLGGFDPIFDPYSWQDYDLTYRACKAGWRVYYEPLAVADHVGKATMHRQLSVDRGKRITERSRLFFVWLNLQDPWLICRHVLAIPWIYGRDLWKGEGISGLMGFFMALRRVFGVLKHRRKRMRTDPEAIFTDRELMQLRDRKLGLDK
jgi:GT2 family glycosyltransferase